MPALYVERDTYSGAVLEREYYPQPPQVRSPQYDPLLPYREKTPEQKAHARDRQSLQRLTRTTNTNFTPASLYVTLTFDDEHHPANYDELRRIRDNFVRRLRAAFPNMKVIVVMGRGKDSERFHLHAIIDGVPAETIAEKWDGGNVKRIEPLRAHNWYNGVDHGADFSGLARYLFDHYEAAQGKGKRWYQTKNLEAPERDAPTIPTSVPNRDNPPPTPSGYKLVGITAFDIPTGRFLRFKYVRIPPPCRPCIVPRFRTVPPQGGALW